MTAVSDEISISVVSLAEKPLLAGMVQFYLYDFSEMEPDGPDALVFDEAGGFGPMPYFDDYWTDDDRHPLLIRQGEVPVGFALLNTHSHRGGNVERNMGEFFIARKYRRRGIATATVAKLFALYPGEWEVAVTHYNQTAQIFWLKAIAASPNVSGLTRHEGDGVHWTGSIWSFRAY